jgi:hypothetical protein
VRSIAIIEGDHRTVFTVTFTGNVMSHEIEGGLGRTLRFRIDPPPAEETRWQLLARVAAGAVQAEVQYATAQRLLERLQTGWRPSAAEIPPEVPQRRLVIWTWAVSWVPNDFDPDDVIYNPPDRLLGRDETGRVEPTGGVMWIDAWQRWMLAEDGVFWWLGEHDALS